MKFVLDHPSVSWILIMLDVVIFVKGDIRGAWDKTSRPTKHSWDKQKFGRGAEICVQWSADSKEQDCSLDWPFGCHTRIHR